jgi:hypothetical protein
VSCATCGYAGIPATANGEEWCPSCEGAEPELIELCAAMRKMKPPRILRHKLAKLAKVGRNDLCPCGSGRKSKRCHGR